MSLNKQKEELFSSFSYFMIALVVFAIGILFYYYFRQPTIVAQYLGIDTLNIDATYKNYINWFPSFAHVFSFSIFTWLILEKHYANGAILFWTLFNLFVEFGQMLTQPMNFLPQFLNNYFIRGTFSVSDAIAIIIAALCAKILIRR